MLYLNLLKQWVLKWNKQQNHFFKLKMFFIIKSITQNIFTKQRFVYLNTIFWPLKITLNEIFWKNSKFILKIQCLGFFLRKTKIFSKSRYARNRQTCRVIVMWTIALNLLCIYGLYFFFYQFAFNFGYFWWGLIFLYFNLTWTNILKNKFYNPFWFLTELFLFINWVIYFFKSWK